MLWYQLVEIFGDCAETFQLFDGIFQLLSGIRDIADALLYLLFA